MSARKEQHQARILLIARTQDRDEQLCARLELFATDSGVSHVADLTDAIAEISREQPDVVVLLLDAAEPHCLESLALLAQCVPEIPVVVLAEADSELMSSAALREGAHDYLSCERAFRGELTKSVRTAMETARARSEALRADARFRRLYENSISGIFETNRHGDFIAANPAALQMLGFASEQDLLQVNLITDLCANIDHGQELIRMLQTQGSIRNAELIMRNAANNRIALLISATAVLDRNGDIAAIEGTMIDVSERRQAQDELMYLAKFDRLTGLANRYLFRETLGKAISRSQRRNTSVALFMIDLDRFKEINDTLGHDAGDALLRAVGSRLVRSLRDGDTVARLGGDEFAVLIELQQDSHDDVASVARKVLGQLGGPYTLAGHDVTVTPSIGIAISPDAGIHSDTLMKAADVAMYRAKTEGRNTFVFYTQQIHDEVMGRVILEQNLRHALDRDEFSLVYQPKVALDSGRIVELEALLRWGSPACGYVKPMEFIPVLERTGMINRVGQWVIEQATKQLAEWQQTLGLPKLSLSLNLSVRQLTQHGPLLDGIADAIGSAGIDAGCLEFEVTESTLMHDPELCIRTLEAMRELGVRVSIDDFGTGFSSLQYLKVLPLHGLKIDRAFVRETPGNANDVAIVNATLALAKSLGLIVTAEGVETAAQVSYLREAGCDLAQGYYFARPQPADMIPQLLDMDAALLPEFALTLVVPEDSTGFPIDSRSPQADDATVQLRMPLMNTSRSRH